MVETMTEEFLWVEKYRPQTIEDCVLPEELKKSFMEIVESGEMQNLLLSGGPGCGKTTVARALCDELDCDHIVINCSEDGNIDTLRTKIRNFASTISLSERKKVVILDEFDYSNAQSTQPALRGFIEEFSKNCRFVLTCNYKNRIIEPLHSRCTCIDFRFGANEKKQLMPSFLTRIEFILNAEGVGYDQRVIAKLITRYAPDWRRIINECQRYAVGGDIDVGVLSESGDVKVVELMKYLKEKDFTSVRKWVSTNIHNDQSLIFRKIYDCLYEKMQPQSIPSAVLILADYQYKAAFVADAEINLTACLTNIMMECDLK